MVDLPPRRALFHPSATTTSRPALGPRSEHVKQRKGNRKGSKGERSQIIAAWRGAMVVSTLPPWPPPAAGDAPFMNDL